MEKKCENCVFCTEKPKQLSFLPNDWICGNYKSKWFNYWPPNGVCEMHTEPTGKTVAEVVGDRGMQAYEGLKMLFNAVCGNNAADEYIDKFLQQDSSILESDEESEQGDEMKGDK